MQKQATGKKKKKKKTAIKNKEDTFKFNLHPEENNGFLDSSARNGKTILLCKTRPKSLGPGNTGVLASLSSTSYIT